MMHTYTLLLTDLALLGTIIISIPAPAPETEAVGNLAARGEGGSVLINVSKVESD
jgi:hypothetical protein